MTKSWTKHWTRGERALNFATVTLLAVACGLLGASVNRPSFAGTRDGRALNEIHSAIPVSAVGLHAPWRHVN